MGENLVSSVTTILLGIISLAVIAVIVSKQANTSGVINAGSSGFAADLRAATSPFSGSSFGNSQSYNSVGYVD